MSHPGATHFSSVQKLMFEMSRNLKGDSGSKAVQSLHLARSIGQYLTGLFNKVPTLNQDLAELAQDKPSYIAHDFLSEHWQPQHSADMLRCFGKIDLAYSASAGIVENIDLISLRPEIRKIVDSLPLVTLQETVKDIARNTLQRQDLYIKKRQKLTKTEQENIYKKWTFGLLPNAPVAQSLKNDQKIGRIRDIVPICEKILISLNIRTSNIEDLYTQLKVNISKEQLSDILMVVMWAGYIHPCQKQLNRKQADATNIWMKAQQLTWRVVEKYGTAIEY